MSDWRSWGALLAALILAAAAAGSLCLTPARLPAAERLPRRRLPGLLLGIPALIWCIPHAAAVTPDFLLPLLWPLAIGIPVLSYFYVENLTARALGGAAIIIAYELIHWSFEVRLPGAPAIATFSWIFGIMGIWISGSPVVLRDTFRLAAVRPWLRRSFALFFAAFALTLIFALILGA